MFSVSFMKKKIYYKETRVDFVDYDMSVYIHLW